MHFAAFWRVRRIFEKLLIAVLALSGTCLFADEPTHAVTHPVRPFQVNDTYSKNTTKEDELLGSVQYSINNQFDLERSGGYATLIGMKKLGEDRCRFVWLTAGHCLTGMEGEKFGAMQFASNRTIGRVTSVEFKLHPEMKTIETGKQNDLALFSFDGKCPRHEVTPFKIALREPGGNCYIHQIRNSSSNPPGSSLDRAVVSRTFWGNPAPDKEFPTYFVLHATRETKHLPFFAGESGSAVFGVVDGEFQIVGVLAATDESTPRGMGFQPRGNLRYCQGGTKQMKWVAEELERFLGGKAAWSKWEEGDSVPVPRKSP